MKKFLLIASLSAFTFGAFAHPIVSDTTDTTVKTKKHRKHSKQLVDTATKPAKPADTTKK